ncbi:MAG: hypothetical protein ACE5ER_01865 [Nitrospinaceae bacterium]
MRVFGEFLLAAGLVSEEALMRAVDRQRKSRILLGRLAVDHGFLTLKDLNAILTHQLKNKKNPHNFGETAIQLELLTQVQVNHLAKLQNESTPLLGALLVELGSLTRLQLSQALLKFHPPDTPKGDANDAGRSAPPS